MTKTWSVYILRCADDSLYTGITTDPVRRLQEHNEGGRLAASYTRGRRPVKMVYQEQLENRSLASKREAAIKQLTRKDKERLISNKQ